MLNMIKAENLKQKRTFQKVLIWLAPTITLLLAFAMVGGTNLQVGGYNWWYVFILPAGMALICALVINNDSTRKFHGLFSVIVDKDKIWYSKIILCTIYLLVTCLIFFVEISLVGFLFGNTIAVKDSFIASVTLFVTCAWQIPLFMYIAMKFKVGITVLISLICNFGIAAVCAVKSIWWIPFAIPARLMCYIIGILPNGLIVEAGTYEFSIGVVVIGLVITVALYVVVSVLTGRWFKEQEI